MTLTSWRTWALVLALAAWSTAGCDTAGKVAVSEVSEAEEASGTDTGSETAAETVTESGTETAAEAGSEGGSEVGPEIEPDIEPDSEPEGVTEAVADAEPESEVELKCCVYDHDCPSGHDCAKIGDAWTGACMPFPSSGSDWCWESDSCGPDRVCVGALPCPCDGPLPEGCGQPGKCEDKLPGCCASDLDCQAPAKCAPGNTCAEPLVFGQCWDDGDCHEAQACQGATLCPCGKVCTAPTAPGKCSPLPTGCCYSDADCPDDTECRGFGPWAPGLPGRCVPAHLSGFCPGDAACCWDDGDCPGGWCKDAVVCGCQALLPGLECEVDSIGFCQAFGLQVDQLEVDPQCEVGTDVFAATSWLRVNLTWHTSQPATSQVVVALNSFTGLEGYIQVDEQPTQEHAIEITLSHFMFSSVPRVGDALLFRVDAAGADGSKGQATAQLPVDQPTQDCLYPYDHACSDGGEVMCRVPPPLCQPGKVLAATDGCYRCVFPQTCSCDDGTETICPSAPPQCAPDEILAYVDQCFACVNPVTCERPEVQPGTTYNLDPATLIFGSLPIGSYRPMISGYDQAWRTCVSLIWYFDSPWSGGFCDQYPDFMPYAIITPDVEPPCGQWEYGGGWGITALDGCADWAEFGAGHENLADFTATLTPAEAPASPAPVTVRVDNRALSTPPLVTLGLRYSTDIPEDVWVQSGNDYGLPDWFRVYRDGLPVLLFDRCDLPVCGQGGGVCGAALPTVWNLTHGSYGGQAFLTWDGLLRVEDPGNDCWKLEPAPAGEYEIEACFGWQVESEGTDAIHGTVKNPYCIRQNASLPAQEWIVTASMGG